MIRVAPEGRPFILIAWAVVLAFAIAGWWIAAIVAAIVAVWVVWFFRDPERRWSTGDDVVLAPADGRVVDVREVDEPAFFGGRAQRICIFMNVFDCHVNRYPVGGEVAYRHYNPGRFMHAADEKASLDNEQSSVGLSTGRGKVLVRQIAGLIARRIVTDHAVGTKVTQGQRLGMIRFGSRVDVYLPEGVRPLVGVGQKTLAGETIIADAKSPMPQLTHRVG